MGYEDKVAYTASMDSVVKSAAPDSARGEVYEQLERLEWLTDELRKDFERVNQLLDPVLKPYTVPSPEEGLSREKVALALRIQGSNDRLESLHRLVEAMIQAISI